jgi:ribosomal protein S27AE
LHILDACRDSISGGGETARFISWTAGYPYKKPFAKASNCWRDTLSVTDFNAAQKWARITKDKQQLLLNNVFCSVCGVTTIIKYTLHDNGYGVLLKGKCKKCGKEVARLIEVK